MVLSLRSCSALVFTGRVEVWHVLVLAFLLGCRERRRHADPPGVLGRDGRPRGHRQRRRPQLRDVQRRPASSGRPSPASRSALFGVGRRLPRSTPSASSRSSSRLLAMRESELRTAARIVAPADGQRGLREPARGPRATSGARRSCCSAIIVVGLVATFGMNFSVVIPPLTQQSSTRTRPGTAS